MALLSILRIARLLSHLVLLILLLTLLTRLTAHLILLSRLVALVLLILLTRLTALLILLGRLLSARLLVLVLVLLPRLTLLILLLLIALTAERHRRHGHRHGRHGHRLELFLLLNLVMLVLVAPKRQVLFRFAPTVEQSVGDFLDFLESFLRGVVGIRPFAVDFPCVIHVPTGFLGEIPCRGVSIRLCVQSHDCLVDGLDFRLHVRHGRDTGVDFLNVVSLLLAQVVFERLGDGRKIAVHAQVLKTADKRFLHGSPCVFRSRREFRMTEFVLDFGTDNLVCLRVDGRWQDRAVDTVSVVVAVRQGFIGNVSLLPLVRLVTQNKTLQCFDGVDSCAS